MPASERGPAKYDAMVVSAHPDDAEAQMGGTLAKLSDRGQRILLVDISDGEPAEFAERGVRATQAVEAAASSASSGFVDPLLCQLSPCQPQRRPQAR